MNRKKKITIIVVILVLLVIAAVMWWQQFKTKEKGVGTINEEVKNETGGQTTATPEQKGVDRVISSNLVQGSRGENVKALQRFLNHKRQYVLTRKPANLGVPSFPALSVDGIFGPKTKQACIWWFGYTYVSPSLWNFWQIYKY